MRTTSCNELQKRGRASLPTADVYDLRTRQVANDRVLRIRQLRRENALLIRELTIIKAEIERLQDACSNEQAANAGPDA